jgi:uncharacterized protein (DUF342 family)
MDADQQEEIRKGLDSGVDVGVYARPELFAIQMYQIRIGLEAGIDVSPYADSRYDWFQMEEIRKGIATGLDISKYASPDNSYECMRQIRKGLRDGVDLSGYRRFHPSILRQLRKAVRAQVNIAQYVNEGYDAEQLEEIRTALKRGIDISPYLIKEMRGIAIAEIRRGLEEGIDVSVYAKIDYSWQQMREIRLGIEGRIDYSQYSNPLYSWQQMREIRLGLERGFDVSEYRSLIFTATDMKRKRLELEERLEGVVQGAGYDRERVDCFEITIAGDELTATLKICADDNEQFTFAMVMDALGRYGISNGVLLDEITKMLDEKKYNTEVVVARGTAPVNGEDGYYQYFFDTDALDKPRVLEDGSVDFHNVQWFRPIEDGARIACYHEATGGTMGKTVKGAVVRAIRGQEKHILSGRNIRLLEDQKTYVACISGMIDWDEGKGRLSVEPLNVVDEVNVNSGELHYDGSLLVRGNITTGARIHVIGDMVVEGTIEGAELHCTGSLLAKQGIKGMNAGSVYVGGELVGNFFEYANVHVKGDLFTNYCLNSNIECDGKVEVLGDKGVIAGGVTKAFMGISTCNLGNAVQIQTVLQVGMTEKVMRRQYELDNKIDDVRKELVLLGNAQIKLQKAYRPEERNAMPVYIKIESAIFTKEKEQEELYKHKAQLDELIRRVADVGVTVRGTVYEGTQVDIGDMHWNSHRMNNMTLRRKGNRFVFD